MGWISAESTPEPLDWSDLKYVLVTDGRSVELGGYDPEEGWLYEYMGTLSTMLVTHWMPLPALPQIEPKVNAAEIK
jgi:hypothetical protein